MSKLPLNAKTPPCAGRVRVLNSSEMVLLRDHFLRLDPKSRRDRFNGVINQRFLETYNTKYLTEGTVVIGYIVDGVVRGAAELHPPQQSKGLPPEVAFSVEKVVQQQGVGSILFERVIVEARSKGYESLRMTTGFANEGMKALARKFGVGMHFRKGESIGVLYLTQRPPSPSLIDRSPSAVFSAA